MARRVVVVLLLLVAAGTLAVALTRPDAETPLPSRQELDERAVQACETFEPQAGAVRDGTLVGQQLYGLLQDTYDDARLSETPGFAERVARLNSAAINGDTETLQRDVLGLQLACQQRRG